MRIVIILLTLGLVACGGGSGGDSAGPNLYQDCDPDAAFIGDYEDYGDHRLSVQMACVGFTRDDGCDYDFEYNKPVNNQVLINITSSIDPPNCLPNGEVVCAFTYLEDETDRSIVLNCGNGDQIYVDYK